MAIALRNKQMLALIIIAFLTLVAITYVALGAAHINLWHAAASLVPNWGFGYS